MFRFNLSQHLLARYFCYKLPLNVSEFKDIANYRVDKDLLTYFNGGAMEEVTLRENESDFQKFYFIPKMLRDVSTRNMSIKLGGTKTGVQIPHPFGFSPTAVNKIGHESGELGTAKAAGQSGTLMILSTLSSVSMEDVALEYTKHFCKEGQATNPEQPQLSGNFPLWFQLYVFKDRVLTKELIDRAIAAGYTALVVTMDTPISGIRYENMRRSLKLPPSIKFANLNHAKLNFRDSSNMNDNFFAAVASNFDPSLTMESLLSFVRAHTNLPIILKGVLSPSDVIQACQFGLDGVIVSNHGARQLDEVMSGIRALDHICSTIPQSELEKIDIYMDGGVRKGSDVVKALLLGAKAVFLGRPVLWSLSYKGHKGVSRMIQLLRNEIDVTMALLGIQDIDNIHNKSEYIMRKL